MPSGWRTTVLNSLLALPIAMSFPNDPLVVAEIKNGFEFSDPTIDTPEFVAEIEVATGIELCGDR